MVIRVLVEGGVVNDNPTLGQRENDMIRRNSAALREALHRFFVAALHRDDIEIKVTVAGGKRDGFRQFVTTSKDDVYYSDLDRKPELRNDWFDEMRKDGVEFDNSVKECVFFWIQEMEAWFLKQPQAVNNWICSEPITMSKQIDIGEDKSIKGKTPDEIEHLQRKPSDIMNTLFQRYLLSGNKDKNGKPKKLEYGKLRHAPRIIPFLDAETMLLQDKELAHFVGFVNHISPL